MNYKREREGALFERRHPEKVRIANPDIQRLVNAVRYTEFLNDIDNSSRKILKAHGIEPTGKASDLPKECSDLVRDAQQIVELIKYIRMFVSNAADRSSAKTLLVLAFGLGQCSLANLLRLNGAEAKVFGKQKQQQNLKPRKKIHIDPTELQSRWESFKKSHPNTNRAVLVKRLAAHYGVSDRTIRRRFKENNIS